MNKIFTVLGLVALCSSAFAAVRINQLGYYPQANKVALYSGLKADSFYVKKAETKDVVFKGALSLQSLWNMTTDYTQVADFSGLKLEGDYYLEISNGNVSTPFQIKKDLYASTYKHVQRGFYYWRASTAIPVEFGGRFARKFGHPDNEIPYHDSLYKAAGAKRDVSGGWYDAGDYGKYVVNAGMSVGLIQLFVLMHPEWSGDAAINIPESGNTIPDLMDELKYELDWLLKMQDSDGGVFFKITPLSFESMTVLPEAEPKQRYVIGKSTSATLDFAAMTAQASKLWSAIDATYATKLLTASKSAYEWALKNPAVQFNQGVGTKYPDVRTGAYGDSKFGDEFLWAKSELWLATGDTKYKPLVTEMVSANRVDWPSVGTMGVYALALNQGVVFDATLQSHARSLIKTNADKLLSQINSSAYRMPLVGFNWGSNGAMASEAMQLLVQWHITKDSSYIRGAGEIADYLLGKNPLSISYVTGIGTNFAAKPHARLMEGDTIQDPIPGYLVGGPNYSLPVKDPAFEKLKGCAPAKCYVDISSTYATNEIAINWQAPLLALLGMLEANFGGLQELTLSNSNPSLIISSEGDGTIEITNSKESWSIGDTVKLKAIPNAKATFLGYQGTINSSSDVFQFVISQDVFIKGKFALLDSNLIRNGNFSKNLEEWSTLGNFELLDGNYAWTSAKWDDSSALVDPLFPGSKTQDVALYQEEIPLAKGQLYQLTFNAKSTQVRSMCISFYGESGTQLLHKVCPTVGLNKDPFRWSFTPSNFEPSARVAIEVGADTGMVWVDNISLQRISGEKQDDIITKVLYNSKSVDLGFVIKGSVLYVNKNEQAKISLWTLTGQKIHSSTLVKQSAVDLRILSNNNGITIVRVETDQGVQFLQWKQNSK